MLERTLYNYRELGLLILRLTVALIFIIHGYTKIFGGEGMAGFIEIFSDGGIFLPSITAWIVVLVELSGGICILMGFLTREFALVLAIIMLGSIWFIHYANGFFVSANGYEYNLALSGACLCLMFSGGGIGSLDKLIFPRDKWTFVSDPSRVRLDPPDNVIF
jgi:putative oxidoreductase